MLTPAKSQKLLNGIREYRKQFLSKALLDLDESGTRIMVNHILTDLLGYKTLEEIKTEYMIKGTYADYVIQIDGVRHFLVEVKALSLNLSNRHLRQAVEYAANEGVEWVVLTNGKVLQLYKVIFAQPLDNKLIFEVDLGDTSTVKNCLENLQYLHRDVVLKKGLTQLWNNFIATEKTTIASLLLSKPAIAFVAKQIRAQFKSKFDEKVVTEAVRRALAEPINLDEVKVARTPAARKKAKPKPASKPQEKSETVPVNTPDISVPTDNLSLQ